MKVSHGNVDYWSIEFSMARSSITFETGLTFHKYTGVKGIGMRQNVV